ncbi:hypothetical protein [Hymenobacter nitidus]|nr:hypothetical protein [Hymenobacter nitidus]
MIRHDTDAPEDNYYNYQQVILDQQEQRGAPTQYLYAIRQADV